jgi:hypothetical protein
VNHSALQRFLSLPRHLRILWFASAFEGTHLATKAAGS